MEHVRTFTNGESKFVIYKQENGKQLWIDYYNGRVINSEIRPADSSIWDIVHHLLKLSRHRKNTHELDKLLDWGLDPTELITDPDPARGLQPTYYVWTGEDFVRRRDGRPFALSWQEAEEVVEEARPGEDCKIIPYYG